jgi:hypothetical protein
MCAVKVQNSMPTEIEKDGNSKRACFWLDDWIAKMANGDTQALSLPGAMSGRDFGYTCMKGHVGWNAPHLLYNTRAEHLKAVAQVVQAFKASHGEEALCQDVANNV